MPAEDRLSPAPHNRITYSCIRCASRKVKCDRQRPCNQCVKRNEECVFKSLRSTSKRCKRVKVQALTNQLTYYKSLLQEQGVDLGQLPGSDLDHNVSMDQTAMQPHANPSLKPKLYRDMNENRASQGDTRYKFVENTLWKRVVEEASNSSDTSDSSESSDSEVLGDSHGLVFGSQSKRKSNVCHPSSDRILRMWKIFTENIDPLTKIVHVPSLRPAIEKAVINTKAIPKSLEALMFAIYSTAVMSLKDEQCKQQFSESRNSLLSRYISATESALSRAKVLRTTSLVTLQAFLLYLFSVRDVYEPRAIWSLTGTAVRIAQVMGLARDGESLGLPLFETEMRRRLWWQLKFHDFRTAELCGLAKFRDLDTGPDATKWPANVDDDQLFPGMTSLEISSNKMTDSAFVAIRIEMTKFAADRVAEFRRKGVDFSQWNLVSVDGDREELDKVSRELEDTLEQNFLRYCDPSQPLHLMSLLITRYGMNAIQFLRHNPRRWATLKEIPSSERHLVWELSLKLLEQYNMAHSNPLLERYAWHFAYFQQWHAIIHVLDTIQTDPAYQDADKAWDLVNLTYKNNPAMVLDMKKPIHVAVGNLCLRAYDSRETAMRNGKIYPQPTPEHVLALRRQREKAKAKREAREGERRRIADKVGYSQTNAMNMSMNPDANATSANQIPGTPFLGQPSDMQATDTTEVNSFYLSAELDPNQDENPNADWDLEPFLNASFENIDTEPVTWEQWDVWLADSNLMPAIPS